MIIGNVTAIKQDNIKRMLAYSSVGHAGYMMIAIVLNTAEATSSLIFYSIVYVFTQIGAFAVIGILETKNEAQMTKNDYSGISKKHPFLAITLAMFMFSLAGIPPFAGFFAKYFIFVEAINQGYVWLTIIAIITSIMACYFYLSVIVQMFFKENVADIEISKHNISNITILLSAIAVVIIGIIPIIEFVQ